MALAGTFNLINNNDPGFVVKHSMEDENGRYECHYLIPPSVDRDALNALGELSELTSNQAQNRLYALGAKEHDPLSCFAGVDRLPFYRRFDTEGRLRQEKHFLNGHAYNPEGAFWDMHFDEEGVLQSAGGYRNGHYRVHERDLCTWNENHGKRPPCDQLSFKYGDEEGVRQHAAYDAELV